MNSLKKYVFTGVAASSVLLMSQAVFADVAGIGSAASAIISATSLSWGSFLDDILGAVQGFGGLGWSLKIAVIVLALIGLMKITSLSSFWDKLGSAQSLLAPALGLVFGVLMLGSNGTITLCGVFAYIGSGAGAILLNELLNAVKAIPGLGSTYISIINMIEGFIPAALASKKSLALRAKAKK